MRYSVAVLVALVGLLPLGGILVICGRYVAKIERSDSETVVTTLGAIKRRARTHLNGDFTVSTWHDGDWPMPATVNAPWLSLCARGQSFAYLIDARASNFNRQQIEALAQMRK